MTSVASACRRVGWVNMGLTIVMAITVIVTIGGLAAGGAEPPTDVDAALKKAEELFKEQHWAEARSEYDRARELVKDWHAAPARAAVEGAVACSLQLQQWDDAIQRAERFVKETKGSFEEAVGERFLAGLYNRIPHWGTKRGSTYIRGQHAQGVYVYSWRKDRKEAIAHYERARDLLLGLRKGIGTADNPDTPERRKLLTAELIGVHFDLASTLARQNDYRYGGWGLCGWWWGSALEPEEDSEAVEEADYEEPRWGWGWNPYDNEPPTGIPLGPDGKPQFIGFPAAYDAHLGDGPKIRFLLDEVQRLDASEKKDDAALAMFRWAMIARSLYGPEVIRQWQSSQVRYDPRGQPLPREERADAPEKKLWELADDESLTIVGGRLRAITLPAQESPVALLRRLEEQYPSAAVRPEAHYARALYFQTRQQFPTAMEEYQALIERYPDHARAASAKAQIQRIEQPDITLDSTGIHLPEAKPKLAFTYRNAEQVEFTAFRLDLAKYVQDRMASTDENAWYHGSNMGWHLFEKDAYKAYLGEQAATWTEQVDRPPANRAAEGSTLAPLADPGAYIVEARVPGGDDEARVLVLVSDIAIVQKNVVGHGLIWAADARTGQPLADQVVRIYEHWSQYLEGQNKHQQHVEESTLTTNADGIIKYQRKHTGQGINQGQIDAVVIGENNRLAFSFFQQWYQDDPGLYWDAGERIYVVTDRPVYRPGSTVHFRIWMRDRTDRKYQPGQSGRQTMVEVHDAKNNEVHRFDLRTDEFGCATGEFQLADEPSLGVWYLTVNGTRPDARRLAGGLFRVEEYRKPEFEVTVKPAKTQARLGETVKARIEARYYFGAPVASGTVTYKVFREDYHHVYWGDGEYDWLYGKGYGRYRYAYPWLPWWPYWGRLICCDGWWPRPFWGMVSHQFAWGMYGDSQDWSRRYESGTRKALRELVAQGTQVLAEDGTCEIDIDTSRAKAELGDRDHRYVVEAEVRDASRRAIEGGGSIVATRHAFFAFVEADGGWYRPGNEVFAQVRTLTPDNVPVAVPGEVIVYRIEYGGPDNSVVKEEVVKQWKAETDAEGRLSFRYPIPDSGQYRIAFKTRDAWDQEVLGNAVFWAAGPDFVGLAYRFNDLEIIADKRTYKVGETAHLLINTAEANSRILFSDDLATGYGGVLYSYRFIDMAGRSMVVDVPIQEKHLPNFFVEATLVRNGRVHTESRELFVPPVENLLEVQVKADKPEYRPGEKGRIAVAVTDSAGKPVQGQVTLTAYDESITYIQDEFGPSPRIFFHGQKRSHQPYADVSLNQVFSGRGTFVWPEQYTYEGQQPDGWQGWWDLGQEGMSLDGALMGAGAGGFRSTGRASKSGNMMAANQPTSSARILGSTFADNLEVGGAMNAMSEMIVEELKPGASPDLVEPEVRSWFADTALWLPDLKLDANGRAETEITFPQSLTAWRIHGYSLTKDTRVGDATARVTTSKDLLVRLQSPRFFIERDEVVLSANVHNYLDAAKEVRAELIVPAELFSFLGDIDTSPVPDSDGNVHLPARAEVAAGGEHRFDWPVKVLKEGMARITVKALTDEESDAVRMAFPVLVHGINKTLAQNGSFRGKDAGERILPVDLPEQIDPEQTRLEITLSPSLAGVMIDALPYLVGYPYGCVEQTMSRFYPSVLVVQTLKKLGTDLDAIGRQRRQMNPGDLKNRFGRDRDPVFDSAELDRMVRAGLQRLYGFQQSDGGWGWWRDESSPYQTSYVLQGLHAARQAGIHVDGGVYERGMMFLQNTINRELAKPKGEQQIGGLQTQAYIAFILSLDQRLKQEEPAKWLDEMYEKRGELNNYGRCLLSLAMANMQREVEARTLLRNVLQFVDRDDTNETAWVRTPGECWWFWWNNDIETNAWTLRLLARLEPDSEIAPRLVKWLLNNRRNGYYWRSTRDTALVIAAMADYMVASGEAEPDYTLVVSIDGKPMREVAVTKENLFTFDNHVVLFGRHVDPGPHEVSLTKKGSGALYYSCYLSYFTKEDEIKGAGNEIFIQRDYFKLLPKTETVNLPNPGAAATPPANQPAPLDNTGRSELREGWTRVPLALGDTVTSGEQIEVVLRITSKNTYDYLAFEDMKPAGCEPVELRSGGRWAGGLCANLELRDEKVVFFIRLLEQGEHVLRYRMRAENPGKFHALPTTGFAMYAPEVRAISDEMHLGIKD